MFRSITAFAVAAVGICSLAFAQPVPPPLPPDQQVHKSTPSKSASASGVKFRSDLGLPLHSLSTLGSRIDSARRTGDPVALAHAASELKVAEKVSGKSAKLTSTQVLGEAAQLAKLRRQAAELQSVLAVSDHVALETEQVEELKKLIAMNQAEASTLPAGQEPKPGEIRKVIVNNYTTQYIDIQINGYLRGQVLPGTTKTFTIDQMWNPIIVKGWGDADETTFGPIQLNGRFGTYTWNINGDSALPNTP